MATTPLADAPKPTKPRWYAPTPAKFLFAVLVMQGILFLSAHYHWFWFNERKGYTVLITVAVTSTAMLMLALWLLGNWLSKWKAQFSLFALLLVIPVSAIPCGWLSSEMERARRQSELVEKASFAQYLQDIASKNLVFTTLGKDFFCDVVLLGLRGETVTASDIAEARQLEQLKILDLQGSQVTDAGLKHVSNLTQLMALDIRGTQVTDAGLVGLASLKKLYYVDLSNTRVTDEGLRHLEGWSGLQRINLVETDVTDAGLAHLAQLTNLRAINLYRSRATTAGAKALGERLPNCRILGVPRGG